MPQFILGAEDSSGTIPRHTAVLYSPDGKSQAKHCQVTAKEPQTAGRGCTLV